MTTTCATPDAQIALFFHVNMDRLVRYLQHSFPRMPLATLEDAACEAYLVALDKPELFADALGRGEASLMALFKKVAWRQVRATWRRKATQNEQGVETYPLTAGTQPGQEMAVTYDGLAAILERAAATHGGNRPDDLLDALLDRIASGDSDTDVATRHGVARSLLNKAKNQVRGELFGR